MMTNWRDYELKDFVTGRKIREIRLGVLAERDESGKFIVVPPQGF